MKTYNGHPSYNHWNVALWFGNDEGLYRMARRHIEEAPTRKAAADAILIELTYSGIDKTPDGVPYCITYIRHAISDL